MKERTVAPWNQHIVYLCYRFGYHINPPSNRCSSRDFEERTLLLLLGQPEASSGKEQAAAGAQQSRC